VFQGIFSLFMPKNKTVANFLLIFILIVAGLSALTFAQVSGSKCDQCGMSLDSTGVARYTIIDSNGISHLACCPVCALRLQRSLGDIKITSFCDYYGPSYPITIFSKNNGTDVTVNPVGALVIVAGGCTKNRLVYNSTAADALLAPPNNGTSKWLSPLNNDTANANPTIMSVAQAALANGAVVMPSPTPTPTPSPTPTPIPTSTPTPTPSPTISPTSTLSPSLSPSSTPKPTPSPQPTATTGATLQCEVCGMDVTSDSQARYKITDGTGNVHYVECFMCAMQLINNYETLHMTTYCDWYGPNYPITVNTSNYGATVNVSPSTALFLRGGSCVTARAANNQTAADNLLANGFSQYTSLEQRYALPSTTQIKLVNDAIYNWYAKADVTGAPSSLMLSLALVVGVIIIGVSIFAFKKLKGS
jgi:hypothetical protein